MPVQIHKSMAIKKILQQFPLRIAVTDYCNLRCFFCSNEGMPLEQKNLHFMDIKKLQYLLSVLKKNGLMKVSLTGGDPTLHPQINKIIDYINSLNLKKTFFHTNGIGLNDKIIEKLRKFKKVAVSLHADEFTTWNKLNCGTQFQYSKLRHNLDKLALITKNCQIEVKHVPIKGYNDSPILIKQTLELCSKNNFKFKFLNFESIKRSHAKLAIPLYIMKSRLKKLGCKLIKQNKSFRGQKDYLPILKYSYKNATGVLIEIGCGTKNACKNCHQSNEIFISPNFDIKPCHTNKHTISIKEDLEKHDEEKILHKIVESRIFLLQEPGLGNNFWLEENDSND